MPVTTPSLGLRSRKVGTREASSRHEIRNQQIDPRIILPDQQQWYQKPLPLPLCLTWTWNEKQEKPISASADRLLQNSYLPLSRLPNLTACFSVWGRGKKIHTLKWKSLMRTKKKSCSSWNSQKPVEKMRERERDRDRDTERSSEMNEEKVGKPSVYFIIKAFFFFFLGLHL